MNPDIQKAYRHLYKDPVMKTIIRQSGKLEPAPHKDLFSALLLAIVSQQLSVKAADTIWNRFILLFPGKKPDADSLLNMDVELIRAAGLSYQKAGYLKNIAAFSKEKTLEYRRLYRKSDEDLIEYLSSIKGVGRWTAEMILLFNLNRPDIFPLDDIGIQQAMVSLYNIKLKGKPLKEEMLRLSFAWQPYRSLASRHLWRWKDSAP
ncbi:MAG: DNA-3-methyladenine glycosylase 2 family protein [Bacteroidia bacterium]|nr:DNA-3-methyladenine glycosylase 2 family protein [Bacteroidia bacterium]